MEEFLKFSLAVSAGIFLGGLLIMEFVEIGWLTPLGKQPDGKFLWHCEIPKDKKVRENPNDKTEIKKG